MKKISLPTANVSSVLPLCAENLQDADLRARLIGALPDLHLHELQYKERAAAQELFNIQEQTLPVNITAPEMKKLYTSTFARKGGPTRHIYDAIKLLAPGDICPLCNQRTVSTLDHHLSKFHHPIYAVTPINLVPACKDCNTDTLIRRPRSIGEQTLHPYFDEVDDGLWLFANVEESSPPVVRFYTAPPAEWPQSKQDMVKSHFRIFKLGQLYTTHAAVELANIFGDIEAIDRAGGADAVREELLARATRRRRVFNNAWQAVMLSAIGNSNWFCAGGYRSIGGANVRMHAAL